MKRMALNQLATIRSGYPFRGRIVPEPEGRVRVLQIRDLRQDPKLESVDPILLKENPALAKHRLKAGDVVIPARGDYRQAVLFSRPEATVASSQLLILRLRANTVLPAYLCWALNQAEAQHSLENEARGTNMPLLTRASLGALLIPLPALATQEKIVALQQLWEAEQQTIQRLMSNRETLVHGIMQHLMKQDPAGRKQTAGDHGATP